MPTTEASDNGQQGWLTDQLRGKRVWCSISINCLLICEQKELAVVRQVILLPGCRVRQLELKPADQQRKTSIGITRHFMSTTASRLDKFHFVLENPVTGQQFLFGVDTLCDFNQWQMVLDKACLLRADAGVGDSQQIGNSNKWNSQLKRASSEPQISTGVALDHSLNPCVPFTTVAFVTDDIYPVQFDHEQIYVEQPGKEKTHLEQPDHEKTHLEQPDHEKTHLEQPDKEKTHLEQPDHDKTHLEQPDKEKTHLEQPGKEKTHLEQPGKEKTDLEQPGKEKTHLEQPGKEKTHLEQPGKEKTHLVKPGKDKTDLVQPDQDKTDLVQPDQNKTDLVQPNQDKTDLVQPDQDKTDLVQPNQDKTDLVQPDQDKTDLEHLDQDKADLVQPYEETTGTLDSVQRIVHNKPDNTRITSLPMQVKHEISHTANTVATRSNNQRTARQARPVLRFKPSLGAVFRRLTRSASTGSRRQLHSLPNAQTDDNITELSRASETDCSDLILKHQKQFFGTRPSPEVTSAKGKTNSNHNSFSFPRLASRIFDDSTFYKDVFSKPAVTTLKDLKEVRLSGQLLCRSGSTFGQVYCALARGFLYMFSSTRPDAVPERTVVLSQYTVTYVSEMHERSGNLFTFKLSQPGRHSIFLSADCQETLLKWMTATQSASVRIQSAEDLVSELLESKQGLDMRSTRAACLQGCPDVECNTRQSCSHLDVPSTDLIRQEELEKGPELDEIYNLGILEGLQQAPTSNTYTSNNSVQQSASPATSRRVETPSMLEATHDLFRTDHVPLNCHQYESSRMCDFPTNVPHGHSAGTSFEHITSENSMYVQSRTQSAQTFNSPTHPVVSFQTASTRPFKGFKEANTPNVPRIVPGVCSTLQQDVKITDDERQTTPQHPHSPGVVSAHHTNQKTVLDPRDEINQSLRRCVLQPNQLESLAHDEAVRQAWATTEPCLLEVVEGNIQQRHTSRTIQTDQFTASHDVCIVEDDWNLADTHMVTLPALSQPHRNSDWNGASTVCDMTATVRHITDSNRQIMDSSRPAKDTNQPTIDNIQLSRTAKSGRVGHKEGFIDQLGSDNQWHRLWLVHCDGYLYSHLTPEDDHYVSKLGLTGRDVTRVTGVYQGRHFVIMITGTNENTLLSFDNNEQCEKWLESMTTALADVALPSSTQVKQTQISSLPTSLDTTSNWSAGTARHNTSADTDRQHTEDIVKQTNTDTAIEVQQLGSVKQAQSLDSAKQTLLAEIVRQKLQLKTMQAARDGVKAEAEVTGNSYAVSVSPARRSLPLDVDKVCVMTKLLQRRMSTQIQLNAVHSQMEASRDSSKEKNVLFQIGKKRTDTAQESAEINSYRSELEEQAKVLSLQLRELDTFLSAYDAPSPAPHLQARNKRLRHSYDQALLKNIQLTAETQTGSSNSLSRNHEKLKDKVSQLYRSLSLKSSVQKFAQKTFSRANWHRNKKSTHQIEEKVIATTSSLTTSDFPGGTSVVTDGGSKELYVSLNRSSPIRPNRMAHKEKISVGSDQSGPCQDESSLQNEILLTMQPSLRHFGVCSGNIPISSSLSHLDRFSGNTQMSRSLTDLDRCTKNVQMSPTLIHLDTCRHDIQMPPYHLDRHTQNVQMSPLMTQLGRRAQEVRIAPSSSSLNKLSFKQKNATGNSFCDSTVTSQLKKGDLLDNSVTSQLKKGDLLDNSVNSQLKKGDLLDNSVNSQLKKGDLLDNSVISQLKKGDLLYNSVNSQLKKGDLLDNSVISQLKKGDLLDNSVNAQGMEADLPDTAALSAIVNPGDSSPTENRNEITTSSRRIRSEEQENFVSEPTGVRGQGNIGPGSTSVRGQGNAVPGPDKRQVSASTLAEIEAFETLLEKCLGPPDPSFK